MDSRDSALLTKARAEVIQLPIYDAGISIDRLLENNRQQKIHNLSVNENPFGMSPHALIALQAALETGAIYPDSDCSNLRNALAEKLAIPYERIITGNGSEDILSLICKVFINTGDKVMISKPTFSLHATYAAMMGARIIEVPIDAELNFNSAAWLEKIHSTSNLKMVILANPSNPVGCKLSHTELTAIVNACESETLLVIDEAYIEYAAHEPDFPKVFEILEKQQRPWIVLRTFSKAYGLAGMRIGYGICSSETCVNLLNRVRTPYNVNRLAQIAAIHAWMDHEHLEKTTRFTITQREWMRTELLSLGIKVAPSSSNFLFIDTERSSTEIAKALLEKNVLIKAWKGIGYDSFIRVSVGNEQQNRFFLQQLMLLLGKRPFAQGHGESVLAI